MVDDSVEGGASKGKDSAAEADLTAFKNQLSACYSKASECYVAESDAPLAVVLGDGLSKQVQDLAKLKHAARGVALTLLAYKALRPEQDIRYHKAQFDGGFSARSYDAAGTVPFLQAHSLEYNVETHWLSQTFSFAGPYLQGTPLTTNPRKAGELLVAVVNQIEQDGSVEKASAAAAMIFYQLIDSRSRGKVELTRPKNLTIEMVLGLLQQHFAGKYKSNRPRLPQLAIYAIYRCICPSVARYAGFELAPLNRMKAADRKSKTVGDVVVTYNKQPIEAIETKLEVPIAATDVAEVIQKISSASVERYFLLSTGGIADGEEEAIAGLRANFRKSNGCEIIVNGVLESVSYYLRLLRSPSDFITEYVALLDGDPDIGYEHKVEWNRICAAQSN